MISKFSDDYCHLSGFDPDNKEPVIYAHDGSECTIIEVDGMRAIMSPEEATQALQDFLGNEIGPQLQKKGHFISVSYETSGNTLADVEKLFLPIRDAARHKQMTVDVLVNEAFELTLKRSRYFKILVACWTLPSAVQASELREARAMNKSANAARPAAIKAMPTNLRLEPISAGHQAFVGRMRAALDASGVQARVLGPDRNGGRPDLAEIRRGLLFQVTPDDWKPFGPNERRYPGVKKAVNADMSEFFAPPLSMQIMSTGVTAPKGGRSLRMGGRAYSLAVMQLFPRTIYPFNEFIASIRRGADPDMPLRVAFHMEGGPFNPAFKQFIATFASLTSPGAKNLYMALKEMSEEAHRGNVTWVKSWVLACTWREPNESDEVLERRRSYLIRSLSAWGDAQVTDTTKNPMMTLAETVPGMVRQVSSVNDTFVPVEHMAAMMPFNVPAPVFKSGETVFTTPEGRLVPHAAFSPAQNYWLTLIFATPGSGKSVLMNRLNYEFTAYVSGRKLPYVCVIDVGVSSSGYIRLVQQALPQDQRHLAFYSRLNNHRDSAINFMDTGLGRRMPLTREREFVERFLLTLVGDSQRRHLYEQIVQKVVPRVYQKRSDLEMSSAPTTWEPGSDPRVDEACERLGIKLTARDRWWTVVDRLVAAKDYVSAIRAQRFAMPLLQDVMSSLAEPSVVEDFDEDAVKYMKNAISAAIDRYPMFSYPTKLDFGEARVISIDLNDVKIDGKDDASARNNALMYMIARHLFVQKVGGHADEITAMSFPREMESLYQAYWEKHYEDIAETRKRLCFDEYHMTGGTGEISQQVLADARLTRKWGMEIILVSQLLSDFEIMKSMASTVFVLKAETREMREEIQSTFGFSDAVKLKLEREVHGAGDRSHGINFLANYKLNDTERWIVLNNFLGPTQLWALTTQANDRGVRDECYRRFPVDQALRMLAERYPAGTVGQEWDIVANEMDEDGSIARKIVDNMVFEAKKSKINDNKLDVDAN